jgi:hypothetical protein
MRRTLLRLSLLLCLALALSAADVTGRWRGNVTFVGRDGEKVPGTVLLVLKQDGAAVTGTAGPRDDDQKPILNGKAVDGAVTFNVEIHPGMVMRFTLKQAGEEISGEINTDDAPVKMTATLSAKREK